MDEVVVSFKEIFLYLSNVVLGYQDFSNIESFLLKFGM